MFYFACKESKIYESFTFWNKLQEKLFYDILFFLNVPAFIIKPRLCLLMLPFLI